MCFCTIFKNIFLSRFLIRFFSFFIFIHCHSLTCSQSRNFHHSIFDFRISFPNPLFIHTPSRIRLCLFVGECSVMSILHFLPICIFLPSHQRLRYSVYVHLHSFYFIRSSTHRFFPNNLLICYLIDVFPSKNIILTYI